MKKLLTVLLFALIIIPLSGCNSENKQTNVFEADSNLYVKKTGKILASTDQGIKQEYLLEISANEKYYLESIFVELANPKYQEGQVEVIGLLRKSLNDTYDLIDVEKVTPLTAAKNSDDLTDGKTELYSSFKMGFSLEYNDNLSFRETDTLVSFLMKAEIASQTPLQSIEVEKLQLDDENIELKNFLVKTYNYSEASMIESQLGKANLPAIKIISDDKNSVNFFAKNGKEVYRLTHQSRDEKNKNQVRTLYYQMIYSFSLLNQVQSELSLEGAEKSTTEKEDLKSAEDESKNDEKKPEESDKNDEKNQQDDDKKTQEDLTEEDITIKEADTKEEFVIIASDETEKNSENEKIADNYVLVMAYIQENLMSLIPEADKATGAWKTDSFEFTGKNMVYVLYSSAGEKRKMLLSYTVNGSQVQTQFLAHYTSGEEKDWQKTEGTDPAVGQSKEVIEVSSGGDAVKQAEVKAGYRLFESGPYRFSMQIPMDWYYSGSGGHYGFSNKPVTAENELFGVDIVASAGNGSAGEINGKKAFSETAGEKFTIYLEKSDGRWYKLSGAVGLENTIKNIAGTIED